LRRTSFLLSKAEYRQMILLGLQIAVDHMDDVVNTIRSSKDTPTAHQELKRKFSLLDEQAKAILDMRLARLTGLEREKIHKDVALVAEEIADYNDILSRKERVTGIILSEIDEVDQKFSDQRRTKIFQYLPDEITLQSLVEDVSVVVTLSTEGYIKRTTSTEIQAQRRGGKGRSGMLIRENDSTSLVLECTNHETLLCFSSLGVAYSLKVYELPEVGLRSRGKHFANLLPLAKKEKIISAIPLREFEDDHYIMCLTKKGWIKRSKLSHFKKIRSSGIIGIVLADGDELVEVERVSESDHVFIATSEGMVIRFPVTEVRATGRASRGVIGIRMSSKDAHVVALEIIDPKAPDTKSILSVCANGYGKRSKTRNYRAIHRGGKGVISIKVDKRNGDLVGVYFVCDSDDVVMMTSKGSIIRFNVSRTPWWVVIPKVLG
ncbi:MAG: DNA gyrase subunit A, partial [Proteobacteria bacterium]|nr:DNA gyrase subunit A [Pseudomonadota bacterium]